MNDLLSSPTSPTVPVTHGAFLVSNRQGNGQSYPEHTLLYQFPNGYKVSVVWHYISYGYNANLWEVAVIKDGKIVATEVTPDDVIGYREHGEVSEILDFVQNL